MDMKCFIFCHSITTISLVYIYIISRLLCIVDAIIMHLHHINMAENVVKNPEMTFASFRGIFLFCKCEIHSSSGNVCCGAYYLDSVADRIGRLAAVHYRELAVEFVVSIF